MGMFDYITVSCPECHQPIEEQSKAGPCELHHYTLNDAPLSVLADIAEDELWCTSCNTRLKLRMQVTAYVEHAEEVPSHAVVRQI